jgi:glycosyltransferase involved in cell wall biosynthesis
MNHLYDISVIIPVYNRANELEKTLQSLQNQTLAANRYEVVIADDGSSEDIMGALGQFGNINIQYRRQDDQGFRVAAARNLGLDAASGKIIVFNDNGILFHETCLEAHMKAHEESESMVILGYMYGTDFYSDQDVIRKLLDENNVEDAIAKMERTGGMGDGREGYIRRFGEDINDWYIPWMGLWGGHFSVRNDFIRERGIRFDEAFTSWGGEDNEFGIQLCDADCKYRLARDIKVVHYPTPKPATALPNSDAFKEKYDQTKKYIADKHKTQAVILWLHHGSKVCAMTEEEREEAWRRLQL